MNQKGLPCCHNFLTVTPIYRIKVTFIGAIQQEKIVDDFRIFFKVNKVTNEHGKLPERAKTLHKKVFFMQQKKALTKAIGRSKKIARIASCTF